MKALRKQLSKEQFYLLNIPEDFADEVEIIILATKTSKKNNRLSEDEAFYAANNNHLIEDDINEDQIWSKYLNETIKSNQNGNNKTNYFKKAI
jgi:hypothetical protein